MTIRFTDKYELVKYIRDNQIDLSLQTNASELSSYYINLLGIMISDYADLPTDYCLYAPSLPEELITRAIIILGLDSNFAVQLENITSEEDLEKVTKTIAKACRGRSSWTHADKLEKTECQEAEAFEDAYNQVNFAKNLLIYQANYLANNPPSAFGNMQWHKTGLINILTPITWQLLIWSKFISSYQDDLNAIIDYIQDDKVSTWDKALIIFYLILEKLLYAIPVLGVYLLLSVVALIASSFVFSLGIFKLATAPLGFIWSIITAKSIASSFVFSLGTFKLTTGPTDGIGHSADTAAAAAADTAAADTTEIPSASSPKAPYTPGYDALSSAQEAEALAPRLFETKARAE